jgi:hypothetical protein
MKTILLAIVLTVTMILPSASQPWGWGHREHRDRWEHRRYPPPQQQQQGIDFGAIIGGIAGALGGSRPSQDMIAYCMQRYRSYNPETGVYYGYDGQPRRCP